MAPSVYHWCNPGRYNNSGACDECDLGRFRAGGPDSECTRCGRGKYANSKGSVNCQLCPTGRLANPERSDCDQCNKGQFVFNYTTSKNCTAGRYAPTPQTEECLMCTAGSYTGTPQGSFLCTQCNAGTYAAQLSVNCTLCPVGKRSPSAQDFCSECDAGKFTSLKGSGSCQGCPVGRNSDPGSSECLLAAPEYYKDFNDEYTNCPNNAECTGGLATPMPEVGFWVERRSLEFAGTMYPCPRGTCKGAVGQTGTESEMACWQRVGYGPDGNVSNAYHGCDADALLCTKGALGPLCGACAKGHTFSSTQNICVSCTSAGSTAGYGIGGALVCLLAAWGFYKGHLTVPQVILDSWFWGTLKGLDSSTYRIIWATYQIVQSE